MIIYHSLPGGLLGQLTLSQDGEQPTGLASTGQDYTMTDHGTCKECASVVHWARGLIVTEREAHKA